MVCALRLRAYLTPHQVQQAGHTLFVVHRFRNAAVAWLTDRRRNRAAWLKANPDRPKDQLPVELAGSDALACSRWLTEHLVQARKTVALELGLQASRNDLGRELARAWSHLSRGERESLGDCALWLTVPRTALDQVLRDLEKTITRAIQDRVTNKKQRTKISGTASLPAAFSAQPPAGGASGSKHAPRLAGFPTFHKWSYAGSFRMQVEAAKNRAFREHWSAGVIYIPGLGRIRFRDRQTLPRTPPKLITLARDAASRWHISFLCVAGEGRSSDRQRQLWAQPLVLDSPTGMPRCGAADVGFKDSLISDTGKKSGPGRYLRQQLKRLGTLQRGLSRKTRGSSRWKKTKRQIGRVHARVVQQREAAHQRLAQDLVRTTPILCLEDLALQAMLQRNHCEPSARLGRWLRRAGYDTAQGKLNQVIERQAALHGHLVLRCDRFDTSTQTCHRCNHRNRELTLADRTWTCPHCHTILDHDVNAAINIRRMALERAIAALSSKVSTPSEKEGRTLSSHRLRPDLAAFVARGGLIRWLEHLSSGQDRVDEARVRSGSSLPGRKGTVLQR